METTDLRHISAEDFKQWGLDRQIYIKPVEVEGHDAIAVHNASGEQVGVLASVQQAEAAAYEHDVELVALH
ncbi:MAG: hypothetical protein R3360_08280 [Alphaproteobacteria bacterium]|nr:hypothetical protein [Alphaproteobacteria bacterium]